MTGGEYMEEDKLKKENNVAEDESSEMIINDTNVRMEDSSEESNGIGYEITGSGVLGVGGIGS